MNKEPIEKYSVREVIKPLVRSYVLSYIQNLNRLNTEIKRVEDDYLSKILEAVDGAGLTEKEINIIWEKWRNSPPLMLNKYENGIAKAQLQAIKKAIGERECKGCKGNKVIPVSLIYGKINKVNERLCPNCNGTGKVTVEQAIKKVME